MWRNYCNAASMLVACSVLPTAGHLEHSIPVHTFQAAHARPSSPCYCCKVTASLRHLTQGRCLWFLPTFAIGLLSPAGVHTGGLRAALLIDSSTIDPATAREMAAAAAASSLHKEAQPCSGCSAAHPSLVDAPVSGGTTGASKATLTFMVTTVTTVQRERLDSTDSVV